MSESKKLAQLKWRIKNRKYAIEKATEYYYTNLEYIKEQRKLRYQKLKELKNIENFIYS